MLQQNKTTKFNIKDILVPDTDISDEQLINQIKSEGFIAYGSLVRRYNQRMYRIARSITKDDAIAKDIVQEAHIKAFSKLDSFAGKSSFAAWIASITRNEALMYLRKHKNEVTMSNDEESILQATIKQKSLDNILNQPDSVFENLQLQNLMNKHIDKLSDKFRTVFVLRAIEQFSTRETAKILNINEITVKTRYFRAKRLLRHEIQNYLDCSNLKIYQFGNKKCDLVLHNVLLAISRFK